MDLASLKKYAPPELIARYAAPASPPNLLNSLAGYMGWDRLNPRQRLTQYRLEKQRAAEDEWVAANDQVARQLNGQ